jgi:hypothetical protein
MLGDNSPEQFKPRKMSQDNLMIWDLVIPIKVIGCKFTADQILKEWDTLERIQFPLIHISSLLVAFEEIDLRNRTINSLPWSMHLIKMVDLICCVKSIAYGEHRINNLKKELCCLSRLPIRCK